MTATDNIAFATMVGDEPVFLPIWIKYYSRFIAKSHLVIVVDGMDRPLPPEAEGCQVLRLPRRAPGPGWDIERWRMISDLTTTLLHRFDVVAFNDVDEILVLDPDLGSDLLASVARAHQIGVISPFAIEVLHRIDLEPDPLDPARPVLSQRRFGRINASYCKPCITATPLRWSLGGHYANQPTLHLDRELFLFHLRYVDHGYLLQRQASRNAMMVNSDVAGAGWSKGQDEMTNFLQSFAQAGSPEDSDFRFDWQRKRIAKSWQYDAASDIWRHDRLHNRRTYRIPQRFEGMF